MPEIKVQTSGLLGGRTTKTYQYEKRDGYWWVNFGDGWEKFALPEVPEVNVRTLIRKERSDFL